MKYQAGYVPVKGRYPAFLHEREEIHMRKFYTAEAVTEEHLDKVCDQIADTILDSLPKEHRQVFVLRYWYFMPVEEISKCCNMNKSKVETILFRTGNKLKE